MGNEHKCKLTLNLRGVWAPGANLYTDDQWGARYLTWRFNGGTEGTLSIYRICALGNNYTGFLPWR